MRRNLALTAAVTTMGLTLGACSIGGGGDVEKGSLAELGDLQDAQLTVGSKEFTEQMVLCEITSLALESVGATVERSCGMSGSATVRTALESGDVDLYWEYTGTGWITYLKNTEPITEPREQYEAVARADEEENGVRWLEPAPADNTYAIAVAQEKAAELQIETISEYAELATSDPGKASFCGAAEFFGREDGWPGVQEAYAFTLPRDNTAELAAGPIYNSIDTSDPCNFGEVFATDGRIAALDLKVLEDDKEFFAVYNPAVTVRQEIADKHPEIADIMAPISELLDDSTLQALNAQVDVDGDTPEMVAEDWLRENGFIG